jgi:hypothetical protein
MNEMLRTRDPIVTPAKAGVQRSARMMFPVRLKLCSALLNGLCLADPWVPAFAGTTLEMR